MSGFRKVLLAIVAAAVAGTELAHADVLELTQASKVKAAAGAQPDDGVTAITKANLDGSMYGDYMHPGVTAIRGRFLLPQAGKDGVRDFAKEYGDARKFFEFEVHSPKTHTWISSKDALQTDACHWLWVGATKHEIDSIDDIYWLISDRGSRYPAASAMPALSWAIDPDGKMGVWDGSAIPSIDSVANEGVVSNFLITTGKLTPAARQAARDARLQQLRASQSKAYSALDPQNVDMSPDQVMSMLVEEIARTRADKFPEFAEVRDGTGKITDALGVRKAARIVGQWICEALSNAIVSADQGARVGRNHATPAPWVHDFSFVARRTLITYIERADPAVLTRHLAKDPLLLVSGAADPIQLSDLDLADAALDILYHKPDAEFGEIGVWSARKEDVGRLVDALVACASASSHIEPNREAAVAGHEAQHVALADRALETLATLPNSKPANYKPTGDGSDDPGAAFREAIQSALNKATPESPKANAARQALVEAGLGTVGEVQSTIDRLFAVAITARPGADGQNLGRVQALVAIKGLAGRLSTGDVGAAIQKAIAGHLSDLKARQASGEGDANEKNVYDTYMSLK